MSTSNLKKFLNALENVKSDLTCAVCSELCRNPVTLSKCFHIICGEHFTGLQTCPTCRVSLKGCKTYEDKDLTTSIQATKELDALFKPFALAKPNEPINSETANKRRIAKNPSEKSQTEKASKSQVKNTPDKVSVDISIGAKLNKTLEKRNNKGETTLHVACRFGKLDKVTELLDLGANPNTKDNAGWTPLHEAVQNGNIELVQVLLQHNALVNVPGQSNETPLHEAIRYGHKDIVKELIIHGADISVRNIKGETPNDLAVGELKSVLESAADEVIQTQTMNVTHISEMHSELDFEDIKVFCVSKFRTVQNKLKQLSKIHDNLHIETKFTKKVTHLIVDSEEDLICASSLDVLQGITNELWILSSQWITTSSEESLEPFGKYEIAGVGIKSHNGPKNARYNKYKNLPRLFNGCHFYLHNFTSSYEISKLVVLTKAILTKLITDAGGIVLRRVPNPELIPDAEKLVPYHAKKDSALMDCSHYIIFKDMYQPMYNMKHLKALPVGWLIDCIEKFELCDP